MRVQAVKVDQDANSKGKPAVLLVVSGAPGNNKQPARHLAVSVLLEVDAAARLGRQLVALTARRGARHA